MNKNEIINVLYDWNPWQRNLKICPFVAMAAGGGGLLVKIFFDKQIVEW